jgi:pantothenate kinase
MTPDGLNQLGRLFKEWRIADGEKKQAALYRFEIEFEALLQEASAWQEIRETVDLKRKLIESENKKLKSMSMYVTVEQVKLLLSSIINLIDNSLTDITGMLVDEPLKLKVMKRVATGIARLTSTSPEEITKEQNEEESQNEQY